MKVSQVLISVFLILVLSKSASFATDTKLQSAINSDIRSDEDKARDASRKPVETLDFFGVTANSKVLELIPGSGWYTKILLPYLGDSGSLIGADYAQALWPNFGFMTPERIKEKETWVTTWTEQAQGWGDDASASVNAFQFEELPESMHGKADAVLFIRALHNLQRFEGKGGFLTNALQDTFTVLKPGGTVGIVQHQAREDRPDEWADGNNGYIKKSFVIAKMQEAGFEFVSESSVNENDKDQANVGDGVWRLPPVYSGSRDDPEKKAAMTAIGESHRMTLKFRKPI